MQQALQANYKLMLFPPTHFRRQFLPAFFSEFISADDKQTDSSSRSTTRNTGTLPLANPRQSRAEIKNWTSNPQAVLFLGQKGSFVFFFFFPSLNARHFKKLGKRSQHSDRNTYKTTTKSIFKLENKAGSQTQNYGQGLFYYCISTTSSPLLFPSFPSRTSGKSMNYTKQCSAGHK